METHLKPAVIQGTYADYRRVKGRKVLQLVVEVPIEQAPQVHQIFGEPSPDGSTWVAVALLDPEKARAMPSQPSEKPASGGDKHRLSRQAALRCKDARFRTFVAEEFVTRIETEIDARDFVRGYCVVNSRSEIDGNPEAERRWKRLDALYIAWREAA